MEALNVNVERSVEDILSEILHVRHRRDVYEKIWGSKHIVTRRFKNPGKMTFCNLLMVAHLEGVEPIQLYEAGCGHDALSALEVEMLKRPKKAA